MTDMIAKKCTGCGNVFEVDDRDLPTEGWARQVAEKLPLLCPHCSRELEAEERREAAEREADEYAKRVNRCNMSLDLRAVTFDRLDRDKVNEESIETAERWATGKLRGLVLSGDVGVGKTWIAAAACNRMLEDRGVYWMPVSRLVTAMRARLDSEMREDANRLLTAGRTALVLDDLDKAKPSDFVVDLVYEAIDERVSNGAPLLVTTNLRYPELEQRLGEPIASRLRGYCAGHRLEGADRRVAV